MFTIDQIRRSGSTGIGVHDGPEYAHRRWISATWGTSEANRKAKFYAITVAGRRQLAREVEAWDQLAGLVARLRRAEQR